MAAGGGGSDSDDTGGTSVSTSGSVVDGYVMNATVFRDLNGNGVLDVGEPNTTTDANGDFDLDEGDSVDTSATIIAYGGTDISTGKAFTGQLTAPGDSEIAQVIVAVRADDPTGSWVISPSESGIDAATLYRWR